MATVNEKLTAIADAIRAKTGGTDALSLDGMAAAIDGIQTGGGSTDDVAGALADRTITEFSSNTCTQLGAYAFRGCKSLKTLVAPNATAVGEYAIYQCNALRTLSLPSVASVSINAFRDAQYLEIVDLPKLSAIPSNAFYGCRGLKALILRYSKKVTLNSTTAFTNCYRMLGTKNSGFNPDGERLGFVYSERTLVEEYQADSTWASILEPTQFRALEDYTVDGTITGELDESKI